MALQHVRVRFAPSPTGALHIGGLRTALYNYLFAKRHGGTFIVRIEDTDQKRLVAESEQYIQEALAWLGIVPDEGVDVGGDVGPYKQSLRKAIYQAHAATLVAAGKAYYAFDTPEELTAMRAQLRAGGSIATPYDAIARMQMCNALTLPASEVKARLEAGIPYVVRLKVDPTAQVKFKDEVRGWVQFSGADLDDKVLLKADGLPTYHLANVVDDHLMGITHVIRGEEWLPSAPTHQLLYEALGWKPPAFAHLPLLLRPDGTGKLSKRAAVAGDFPIFPLNWQDEEGAEVLGFRERGYLPEAMCNFLALLGWHPSGQQEVFSQQELIALFSLARITKAGVRFDIQKAKWYNEVYLRALPDEALATRYLLPALAERGINCTPVRAKAIAALIKSRITFPQDLLEEAMICFEVVDAAAAHKAAHDDDAASFLQRVAQELNEAPDELKADGYKEVVRACIATMPLFKKRAIPTLRLAVTGAPKGPALMDLLEVLGKEEVLHRLANCLKASSH